MEAVCQAGSEPIKRYKNNSQNVLFFYYFLVFKNTNWVLFKECCKIATINEFSLSAPQIFSARLKNPSCNCCASPQAVLGLGRL